jgi:nucleoside-diphosphate-sugar epimerase
MRVVVTGGSGKAGQWAVRRIAGAGHDVKNVDLTHGSIGDPRSATLDAPFQRADLTDYGQAVDSLRGADAVVHFAAIPAPNMATDEVTFRTNVTSTYNVFQAAATLGLKRVVWASSETVLGLPFTATRPDHAPIDEACTRLPQTAYALSKLAGEELARQFARWTGIPFIGLRLSNVIAPDAYAAFATWQDDPRARAWNFWGYIDARDCGLACVRALDADTSGWATAGPQDSGSGGLAQVFIIAAADTVMRRPNEELLRAVYPDVPVRGSLTANGTLLSIEKARRLLKFEPEHSWRSTAT